MGWLGWLIAGLAVASAALALTLRQVRNAHDRDTALIGRVRTSALYTRLYPLLEQCDECCIEQADFPHFKSFLGVCLLRFTGIFRLHILLHPRPTNRSINRRYSVL